MRALIKAIVVIAAFAPTIGLAEANLPTPQSERKIDFDTLRRVLDYGNAKDDAIKFAAAANIAWRMGNLDAAVKLYKKSIELYGRIGDNKGSAQQHRNLAALYRVIGNNFMAKVQDKLAEAEEQNK